MKTLLILAAFVLVAGLAPAPSKLFPFYMPGEAHRGGGFVNVVYVASADVEKLCGKAEVGFVRLGCTTSSLMVMPNPCEARFADESFAALQCHENAHQVHGWVHP